jgi:predicted RNA binding protein YcfA (HicA-like mRNA interferase family)
MPPKLRRLSGPELLSILQQFDFAVHSRRGSHIKLRRISARGEKQTLTIVAHRELDTSTLRAIFRQACRYIPEDQLREHFYTE